MKRTPASVLLVAGIIGAVAGWLLDVTLVGIGRPAVILPLTLAAATGLIGVLVVVLALPVFRVVRKVPDARVDPFYATRVVLLAKASSWAGALETGLALAILAFLLTRPVVPAVGSVSASVLAAAGAVILLAGGLIAEKMCTLPPEDDGNKEKSP